MARICIVAHNAYGAISGGSGHIGGVERQTSLMSHWLAGRGHAVSLVTWAERGRRDDELIDGVRVVKLCAVGDGAPFVRFFHPRWSSLNAALARADAELYYHNCAEYVTGQVALWCRRQRRRFVFSTASDPECDAQLPIFDSWRERILYRYGIRHADRLIVQSRRQQQMMQASFGLASEVFPMPCPGPSPADYRPPRPPSEGRPQLLWVGRLMPVKHLELLLDAAALAPEADFHVVGGPDRDPVYAEELVARAARLPNLTTYGAVGRAEIDALYRRASLLCCTSHYEGFPNTFLEAWSHGLPILSTVDPAELISEGGLGVSIGSAPSLVDALRALVADPARWHAISQRARAYYEENHAVDSVMRRFETLFIETIQEAA